MYCIRRVALGMVLALTGAILAACGSGGSGASQPAPSTTVAASATTAPISQATKTDANAMIGSFNTVANDITHHSNHE